MNKTILEVLYKYKDSQVNIDTETGRKAIADEIAYEICNKFVVTGKDYQNDTNTNWNYPVTSEYE